jgi:hypothetical protein
MKATLRAPLLKVNINVELCQGSRADGGVCRYGTQWADPGLGQSPLRVHRTTAWDRGRKDRNTHDSVGGALSADVIGGRRGHVSHRARGIQLNLNEDVEKSDRELLTS